MGLQNDIVILANKQSDGTVFALHPQTKQKIQKDFPNAPLFSQVFLGQEPQVPFQDPPDWDLLRKDALIILLTNLSIEDLKAKYPQANILIDYPKSKITLNLIP
jgi:hypothetical protein